MAGQKALFMSAGWGIQIIYGLKTAEWEMVQHSKENLDEMKTMHLIGIKSPHVKLAQNRSENI